MGHWAFFRWRICKNFACWFGGWLQQDLKMQFTTWSHWVTRMSSVWLVPKTNVLQFRCLFWSWIYCTMKCPSSWLLENWSALKEATACFPWKKANLMSEHPETSCTSNKRAIQKGHLQQNNQIINLIFWVQKAWVLGPISRLVLPPSTRWVKMVVWLSPCYLWPCPWVLASWSGLPICCAPPAPSMDAWGSGVYASTWEMLWRRNWNRWMNFRRALIATWHGKWTGE